MFRHGVVVKGFCEVNSGKADVIGTLRLDRGAVLIAQFARDHRPNHTGSSSLTVTGDLIVGRGATAIIGCGDTEAPCLDDPNPNSPTLKSVATVTGNVIATRALGIIVHVGKIGGDVIQTLGGGGVNCNPSGVFASLLQAPVFSDYEDSSVAGDLQVMGLKTCWLGIGRVHVKGNLRVLKNELADPDGIEILSNHVRHDLVCRHNTHPSGMPPGTRGVWDSAELPTNPMGAIYPRMAEPNTVRGHRFGQCRLASPSTAGGKAGPGKF